MWQGVKQLDKAKEVLKKGKYEISHEEGRTISVKVQSSKVSEVVKLLVKSDVDIDEVIKKERDLEDIFFSATQSGK